MEITLLDGGMGQELLARTRAEPTGLWSARFLLDEPELVRAVHDDYFAAGAAVATTNNYAIHRDRLERHGLVDRFAELHRLACQLAVASRDAHGAGLVAGSLGPTGGSYRPEAAPPVEEAAEIFSEIVLLQRPYVDLFLCETMSSVAQARGAVTGACAAKKPVWLAVTVDDRDGTVLRSGEPLTDILPLVDEFGLAALLVNCSPPEAISQAVSLLANQTTVPVGAYANGFVRINDDFLVDDATVDKLQRRSGLGPERYADFALEWVNAGASVVGGCCEVGPAHIRELAKRLR